MKTFRAVLACPLYLVAAIFFGLSSIFRTTSKAFFVLGLETSIDPIKNHVRVIDLRQVAKKTHLKVVK